MSFSFVSMLSNVQWATPEQKAKEHWDVAGILKGRLNQKCRFDIRPLEMHHDIYGKKGTTASKADKIVFELKDKWVIIDAPELHRLIIIKRLKKLSLDKLISMLEWNIILPKTD